MLLMPVMILLLLVLLLLLSLVRCTRIASSSSVVSVLICVTTATFFETGFSRSSFLTRKSRKPAADLPSLGNPRGILGFVTRRPLGAPHHQPCGLPPQHGDRRVPVEAGRQLPCAAEVQELLRQLLQEGARYFFIR